MDKPELPIRTKIVQKSFSGTDANNHLLRADCETARDLESQQITKRIQVELIRPESPLTSRYRITRSFSRADVDRFLTAADKVLTLLQMREHHHESTPRNGVEFSVDVSGDLKLGTFVPHAKEPLHFIELRTAEDSIRFDFSDFDNWDAFRQVFIHGL